MRTAVPYLDVRETHTGVVVLAGDRAFKAKKPVVTDFLDFRTPEQRERACRREVELNSRLSPESYLGVAHLSDPAGGPAEPVVVMRRYRDTDRLASLVTIGADEPLKSVLDSIAEVLAGFHQQAERSREIDAQGEAGASGGAGSDNLVELECYAHNRFRGSRPNRSSGCGTWPVSSPPGGRPCSRAASRRAASSTGTAICWPTTFFGSTAGPPCSTAWSSTTNCDMSIAPTTPRFSRWTSSSWAAGTSATTSSNAMPSMPRTRPRPRCGTSTSRIVPVSAPRWTASGCHRAGPRPPTTLPATSRSRPATSKAATVRLALVGGNPGTGKSTIARMLAERFGAQVISTDDVRRELRDSGVIGGDAGVLDDGLYSPGNVATVYDVVLRRRESAAGAGAIGSPRRHLAGPERARAGATPCRRDTFRDGRAPVLHDGRHGRRPDHDEAARQLRGDPGDRRGHGGAAGGLADRAPARHHNNARSAVGRGRRRLAARVVGAGVGGRGKVSAAADTSAEKGRRTARAPEDQRL